MIWCFGALGVIISAALAYRARKHEKEAMWNAASDAGTAERNLCAGQAPAHELGRDLRQYLHAVAGL
jgi:hypothetical protein